MNNIKTKWKYMADRCAKEGLTKASVLADNIDTLLRKLDYPEYTVEWLDDVDDSYDSADNTSLVMLAFDGSYCVACERHSMACDKCDFANAGGKAMFNTFVNDVKTKERYR